MSDTRPEKFTAFQLVTNGQRIGGSASHHASLARRVRRVHAILVKSYPSFLGLAAALSAASGCGRVGFEDQLLGHTDDGSGASLGSGGEGGASGFGGAFPGVGGLPAVGGSFATGGDFNLYPVPIYHQSFESELSENIRTSDSGSFSLQSAQVYFGTSALKVWQSSEEASAFVVAPLDGPLENEEIYFRAWVFIPSHVLIAGANLVGFHPATGLGTDVNAYADRVLEIYSHVTNVKAASATNTFPQGQWFCLQIANYIHDTEGRIDVAVNETRVVELGPTDTLPTGGIDHVVYGMAWVTEGQENFTAYFDEVAIASEPIPCQPQ